MVKLVDTLGLDSNAAMFESSSLSIRIYLDCCRGTFGINSSLKKLRVASGHLTRSLVRDNRGLLFAIGTFSEGQIWMISSIGRASVLHAEGRQFKSAIILGTYVLVILIFINILYNYIQIYPLFHGREYYLPAVAISL